MSIERLDPIGIAEIASARCVRAKAAARLGRAEEGERLAREAVALIDQTDFLIMVSAEREAPCRPISR